MSSLRDFPSPNIPSIEYNKHHNATNRVQLHDDVQIWVRELELSPDWIEVENRPWSNENNRYTLYWLSRL
eukprot:UN07815